MGWWLSRTGQDRTRERLHPLCLCLQAKLMQANCAAAQKKSLQRHETLRCVCIRPRSPVLVHHVQAPIHLLLLLVLAATACARALAAAASGVLAADVAPAMSCVCVAAL